ncbi:MAG: hypothetical protein R8P61_05060 [Bacteroidia bacterium]|nr:hypothetical protein [Bacteroidia bacterium]
MKTLIYLFAILFLISCSKAEIQIEERSRFGSEAQTELLGPLTEAPQSFKIDLRQAALIKGKAGTNISIPKGAFVNKRGEVITENIEIELVEAFSMKDFFANDLSSLSGDRILQSAGMIYIDAQVNGEALALQEDMNIDVEIPYSDGKSGYRMFSGVRDERGKMDWELEEDSREELIPLPLDSLYLKAYNKYRFNRTKRIRVFEDSLNLNDSKFAGTFIATEAFEDRFWMILDRFNYLYGYWYHPDYWEESTSYYDFQIQNGDTIYLQDWSLLNIYLDNLDQELSTVDSMVFPLLKERLEKERKMFSKMERYDQNWFDWNYKYIMEYFENALQANLGRVAEYDPRGVDMDAENTESLLIASGYTEQEAYEQMRIHRRRSMILQNRQMRMRVEGMADSTMQEYEKNLTRAFKINQLGWANCDRFYNDPHAKEVELYVKLDQDNFKNKFLILMLPKLNIAIPASGISEKGYYFSFESNEGIRLPLGKKAAVIAMDKNTDGPLFAMESFEIEEVHNFELKLKPASYDIIEKRLSALK